MSTEWKWLDGVYAPDDAAVLDCYVRMRVADGGIPEDEANAEFNRWQGGRDGQLIAATLTTVHPNPDDARQVETVARTLFLHSMGQEAAPAWDAPTDTGKGAWLSRARAVLTALAAMGGEG